MDTYFYSREDLESLGFGIPWGYRDDDDYRGCWEALPTKHAASRLLEQWRWRHGNAPERWSRTTTRRI